MVDETTSFREFERGLRAGFIDSATKCADDARPMFVCNSKEAGTSLLSVIERQLATCRAFDFCVAFVADSGLQPLVEVLADLARRGVKGRFLTSTYLNFNSPDVFRKLLDYPNIDTRVYQGSMHAKGYLFESAGTSTVIVGSSNLTQSALTCNKEWNVLFRSYDSGGMLLQMRKEFNGLWSDDATQPVTPEWVDQYERYRKGAGNPIPRRPTFFFGDDILLEHDSSLPRIRPNAMQRQALGALKVLHERHEPRALLVSATGTGKTYLSAFDVSAVKPRRILFLVHRRRILQASMKSYQTVLGDRYTYGLFEPGKVSDGVTCLFAMCSTICRHLEKFAPDAFDYIVIDEAHRTGSGSYQAITSYFKPGFYLGMTATPNRTGNDFDVCALFNHVIAYQITLQDALANDMLAPFHYFGIADLAIDYEEQDDLSLFSRLTSSERVRHITEKIEEYTVDRRHRKGLVFCNRNDEARNLSDSFNKLGYRTVAVSGEDGDAARDNAIARLESGELEYIFSVDIFNEGIDIPPVNQIIMLRRTESAIVFVQQLGRGLRKSEGKDYTLVLDFIGNYQKNFFVPVALSGDRTFNKDGLRRIVHEGSTAIPGCSTVSFDKVSEARIYKAIDGRKFTAAKFLKDEYMGLRQMLGHIPTLQEFDKNGSIDPLLIMNKFGSYHAFLNKYEQGYDVSFSERQCNILKFVSRKLANGKRADELELLKSLILGDGAGCVDSERSNSLNLTSSRASAIRVLSGSFSATKEFTALVEDVMPPRLSEAFARCLSVDEFRRQLLEVIDFGIGRHAANYRNMYKDTSFVLNCKYTYEEVCRLLNWSSNISGLNIGGYKYDVETNTFPVFINYDKDPSISDSIKYEDRFVSETELVAISKQPRYLDSPEIERLRAWPGNGMKIYLFMRKNTKDGDGKEFYFLGEMVPTGEFREFVMPTVQKSAVEITYRLSEPVRPDLYAFLTSNLSEDEGFAK